MVKHYALGFYFSADGQKVALIRKLKPEWQKGKLNGVGGHVEEGESFRAAMRREFEEETGVVTYESDWRLVVEQRGEYYVLAVFACFASTNVAFDFICAEEKVEWFNVRHLSTLDDAIHNVKWMIPLCLDKEVKLPLQVFA